MIQGPSRFFSSVHENKSLVLKIYFNDGKVLEQVFSQEAVNFLSYGIGDIGKIVHHQKLVIAPYRVSGFHRCLDPRRIAHQTRPFPRIRATSNFYSAELQELRTQDGMAGAGVHNQFGRFAIDLQPHENQTEAGSQFDWYSVGGTVIGS